MPRVGGAPWRGGPDDGASLIVALVFVMLVGLLASVLLAMAFTGLRSTHAYRQERIVRYNAESALNLTIARLADDPNLGDEVDDPACGLTFPMIHDTSTGADAAIVAGSVLVVTCGRTPIDELEVTSDDARDVTITVTCHETDSGSRLLQCGGGGSGSPRPVAEARVRFEPNRTAAAGEDTSVPKIVSWDADA